MRDAQAIRATHAVIAVIAHRAAETALPLPDAGEREAHAVVD